MQLIIDITGPTPEDETEFVRRTDAQIASINGINDWTIRSGSRNWVWDEFGGHWENR